MAGDTPSKSRTQSRRSVEALAWTAVAFAIIVLGIAGADRWFYESASLRLNDETRPLGRDFHAITRPVWEAIRFAFASIFAAAILTALGAVLDDKRWKRYVVALACALAVALAGNVLQGAVGRIRPNQADSHLAFKPPLSQLFTKQEVCFPSGEATLAFAIATPIALFFPRWRYLAFACAALGASARLINGAHYPSDVAAGALLGCWGTRGLLVWWSRHRP
jgi:membrane-associated phospholipid phosphatase